MSATVQRSPLNIVMGAMTFGGQGKDGVRIHELDQIKAILEVFAFHGHTEIDTSRVYGFGSSEECFGKLCAFLKEKRLKVETKLYTHKMLGTSHTSECMREHLHLSLKALNTDCLEMWYLHAPDRSVPFEVTMNAVDNLYKEGHFKRFGISNYTSIWEVAEIVGICKANGYVQPTVYQGTHNAIHRLVEPELFPCLRKFGISFYEFNPLGGGFFTGRYTSINDVPEAGSRFDGSKLEGKNYRDRYWNDAHFNALDAIRAVCEKNGLTMSEVALRWISHHSLLKRDYGDAVLIGASTLNHIEQNLIDLEKGPLPEEITKVLDEAWDSVKPFAAKYYH